MPHEPQISRTFYITPCLWPRAFGMCGHGAQQSQVSGHMPLCPRDWWWAGQLTSVLAQPCRPPADQNNGCSNISISDDSWQKQKYKYKLEAYQTNTPIQANKTNKEKNNKMSQKQDHHMQQSQKTWAQVYCTCPKSLNPSRILRTWKIPIFLILWWPS